MVEYFYINENENLVPLQEIFRLSSSGSGPDNKNHIIHNSIVKFLISYLNVMVCGFIVHTIIGQECDYFPHIFSYSYDIRE